QRRFLQMPPSAVSNPKASPPPPPPPTQPASPSSPATNAQATPQASPSPSKPSTPSAAAAPDQFEAAPPKPPVALTSPPPPAPPDPAPPPPPAAGPAPDAGPERAKDAVNLQTVDEDKQAAATSEQTARDQAAKEAAEIQGYARPGAQLPPNTTVTQNGD